MSENLRRKVEISILTLRGTAFAKCSASSYPAVSKSQKQNIYHVLLNDLYHPWNKDIKRLLCKNYSNHLAWFFMHVTHTIHLWALFRNLLPARMNCIVFRSSRAIGSGRGIGAGEQLPSTSPPHNGRPLFIFITGLDYKKWSFEAWSLNHSGIF